MAVIIIGHTSIKLNNMDSKTSMHIYMCVFMIVFTCGSQSVNYSIAVDKCKERNGLASYKHFMNYSGRSWDQNKSLQKIQSAWISGNVVFPDKFVRWYGCYGNAKQGLYKVSLSNFDIYECLQKCSNANNDFIGITDKLCYCISNYDVSYRLTLTNDSECKQVLFSPNVSHRKAFSSKIDVYEDIAIDRLTWKPSSNKRIGQCVYYQDDEKEKGYVTGSCNSKETGFMCTNTAGGQFKANCSDNPFWYFDSRKFCYYLGPSTWRSSFKQCRQYLSNLPGLLHNDLRQRINQRSMGNVTFWTGLFRSFKLNDILDKDSVKKSTICLSVINVNNTLVFEPAECSSDNDYICEDDVSNNEKQPSYKTTFKTPFLSSKNTSDNKHSTSSPDISDNRHYIIIIVVLIIVFTLFTIICFIFRKKIKKHLCICEAESRSKDVQETTSANTGFRLGSPDNINIAHSNKSTHSESEYALPSDDVPTSEAVESEYDRVDTSVSRKQVRDNVCTGNDANEYGVHTGLIQEHDNDDYDHLEAHTSKHIKAATDGIYNTMTEDNDTYNALNLKKSVNIEQSSPCIEKSCTTYDKLN